jgi:EthD domain
MGPLFPLSHSRFYLGRNASDTSSSDTTNANHHPTVFAGTPEDFDYDVLAALVFEDMIAFEASHARLRESRKWLQSSQRTKKGSSTVRD